VEEFAVKFENEGATLFGMMHLPEGPPKYACVVFLHGYPGNRIGDHCLFVKTARDFCEHGIACLRFDFRGSGESQGAFAEVTLEGEISDAKEAIKFLGKLGEIDLDRIGLLGLSIGASVATCLSANGGVRSLALWAPAAFIDYMVERDGRIIKDPYVWLPKDYQDAIKKRGHVDIGGYLRGKAFFESMKRIDPIREIAKYDGPVLVVQGSEDEVLMPLNSEFIYDNAKGKRRLIMIDGADHTFSSAGWERQVIEATRNWFEDTL
jgi:pimeloyl-ACP methyl ester carboxylesterase